MVGYDSMRASMRAAGGNPTYFSKGRIWLDRKCSGCILVLEEVEVTLLELMQLGYDIIVIHK